MSNSTFNELQSYPGNAFLVFLIECGWTSRGLFNTITACVNRAFPSSYGVIELWMFNGILATEKVGGSSKMGVELQHTELSISGTQRVTMVNRNDGSWTTNRGSSWAPTEYIAFKFLGIGATPDYFISPPIPLSSVPNVRCYQQP